MGIKIIIFYSGSIRYYELGFLINLISLIGQIRSVKRCIRGLKIRLEGFKINCKVEWIAW
jgi:hypothetical protein